jgi:hypothetical protein
VSNFVRLSADGFYYNEIAADLSDARLELSAFADITDATSINVNVMSHLESARIEYLVREEGQAFGNAKQQAHAEVLGIFGFDAADVPAAESLDIAAAGAANGKLLAISILTQGFGSVAELTERLSRIQTDLRSDGALDSASTGSALVNVAAIADLTAIRAGLEQRYADLGLTAEIPDFESEIESFLTTTSFERTNLIAYPETGSNGCTNLLFPDLVAADAATTYCLAAEIPEGGSLRVRLVETTPGESADFGFDLGEDWTSTLLDNAGREYDLETTLAGLAEIPSFTFGISGSSVGMGSMTFDYFEFGATDPAHQKTATW